MTFLYILYTTTVFVYFKHEPFKFTRKTLRQLFITNYHIKNVSENINSFNNIPCLPEIIEGHIYDIDTFYNEFIKLLNALNLTEDKINFSELSIKKEILNSYYGCTDRCQCCGRKCEEMHNFSNTQQSVLKPIFVIFSAV